MGATGQRSERRLASTLDVDEVTQETLDATEKARTEAESALAESRKENTQLAKTVADQRVRESLAQKAEKVLVDEVEVPKAMDVAGGWMIADGMSLIRIGQTGQDVPWRRDRKVKKEAAERLELQPTSPLSGQ